MSPQLYAQTGHVGDLATPLSAAYSSNARFFDYTAEQNINSAHGNHTGEAFYMLSKNKTIGERIDTRCTRCGGRNMQITEELIGSSNYEVQAGKVSAMTSADTPKSSGRFFGRCRQCGHNWVFRKNPLAS